MFLWLEDESNRENILTRLRRAMEPFIQKEGSQEIVDLRDFLHDTSSRNGTDDEGHSLVIEVPQFSTRSVDVLFKICVSV